MDFYIKQNSTMPYLVMEFEYKQYQAYNFEDFYKRLENADILFTMTNVDKCYTKIKCKPALLYEITDCADENCPKQYIIIYKFEKKDTSKKGMFEGQFDIKFSDNGDILRAPIRDKLLIHVI